MILAYLARPELIPPDEACAAERTLYADLLAAPAAFSGARAGADLGWHPKAPDLLSGRS